MTVMHGIQAFININTTYTVDSCTIITPLVPFATLTSKRTVATNPIGVRGETSIDVYVHCETGLFQRERVLMILDLSNSRPCPPEWRIVTEYVIVDLYKPAARRSVGRKLESSELKNNGYSTSVYVPPTVVPVFMYRAIWVSNLCEWCVDVGCVHLDKEGTIIIHILTGLIKTIKMITICGYVFKPTAICRQQILKSNE